MQNSADKTIANLGGETEHPTTRNTWGGRGKGWEVMGKKGKEVGGRRERTGRVKGKGVEKRIEKKRKGTGKKRS